MVLVLNDNGLWELGYRGSFDYLVREHKEKGNWYPCLTIRSHRYLEELERALEGLERMFECRDCTAISVEELRIPLAETKKEIVKAIERGEYWCMPVFQVYVSEEMLGKSGTYVEDFARMVRDAFIEEISRW